MSSLPSCGQAFGKQITIDCKCIIKNEIKHHNSGKEDF